MPARKKGKKKRNKESEELTSQIGLQHSTVAQLSTQTSVFARDRFVPHRAQQSKTTTTNKQKMSLREEKESKDRKTKQKRKQKIEGRQAVGYKTNSRVKRLRRWIVEYVHTENKGKVKSFPSCRFASLFGFMCSRVGGVQLHVRTCKEKRF